MTTWSQLIENAWRDIRDADRCVALSITPAAYQLHRRLRQVVQAMEALLTDEAVERAARAYEAHTTAQVPSEDQEFSCAECGYAFDWREVPHLTPPFGAPAYNTERMLSRRHEHGMRAALMAAIEGEQ